MGAALTEVSRIVKTDLAKAKQQADSEAEEAMRDILAPTTEATPEDSSAADELLRALRNDPD